MTGMSCHTQPLEVDAMEGAIVILPTKKLIFQRFSCCTSSRPQSMCWMDLGPKTTCPDSGFRVCSPGPLPPGQIPPVVTPSSGGLASHCCCHADLLHHFRSTLIPMPAVSVPLPGTAACFGHPTAHYIARGRKL